MPTTTTAPAFQTDTSYAHQCQPMSMPAFASQAEFARRKRQRPANGSSQDSCQAHQTTNGKHQMRRSSSSSKLQGAPKWRQPPEQAQRLIDSNDASKQTQQAPQTQPAVVDYDEIRNKTLMFFLDKLYLASRESSEPRTLHDLSCLFGNKGFTREMRQVVGSSRAGLRKFLESCPSLFTVDGDQVLLTDLSASSSTAETKARNYTDEAIDYFRDKLQQFGASEVPVKNLFGYRSQASQRVRHVSGQNLAEFRAFLAAHSNEFELLPDKEHVILKSVASELRASVDGRARGAFEGDEASQMRPIEHTNDEASIATGNSCASCDPYLNKQFALVVEQTLREMLTASQLAPTMGEHKDADRNDYKESNNNLNIKQTNARHRVPFDELHAQILAQCKDQLLASVASTEREFKMFLRMHPNLFTRIQDDQDKQFVALTPKLPLSDDYNDADCNAPSRLVFGHLSLLAATRLAANKHQQQQNCNTSEHQQKHQPKLAQGDADDSQSSAPAQPDQHSPASETGVETETAATTASLAAAVTTAAKSSANETVNSTSSSSLRAAAPPFVPSTPASQTGNPASGRYQMRRSVSNVASVARDATAMPSAAAKAAIRNYLSSSSTNNSHCHNSHSQIASNNSLNYNGNGKSSASAFNRDSIQAASDVRARTVTLVSEASKIVSLILTSAKAVAFDCLGSNFGSNGQIALLVLCFWFDETDTIGHKLALASKPDSAIKSQRGNKQANQATTKPEACIFDFLLNPELAFCLKPLFECEHITKVAHDVRNKSNALYNEFGILLSNVFDTQVANLVIQQQSTGKPAYKSRYISMSKLVELYGSEQLINQRNMIKAKTSIHFCSSTASLNKRSNGFNNTTSNGNGGGNNTTKYKDVYYWRMRPLTNAMLREAIVGAYCLMSLYEDLASKIRVEYEPLLRQLNLEGVLALIKPEEIKSVRKERKIDLEVIDLKRKLYEECSRSHFIVLSNREIRLLRHIDLTDQVRAKIQQSKKVAKKLERLDQKAAHAAMESLNGVNSLLVSSSTLSSTATITTNSSSSSSSTSYERVEQCDAGNLTNGESLTDAGIHSVRGVKDENKDSGDRNNEDDDEFSRMTSLIDSSIFDALRDTMIKPGLIESLGEDEDDIVIGEDLAQTAKSNGIDRNRSQTFDAKCSTDLTSNGTEQASGNEIQVRSGNSKPETYNDASDSSTASLETTKSVDTAIQCDLIS